MHGVNRAALPTGVHQLGDGGLDAVMGVGSDQLHATQATPAQLPQKLNPERRGVGRANVHAEHLAPAVRGRRRR